MRFAIIQWIFQVRVNGGTMWQDVVGSIYIITQLAVYYNIPLIYQVYIAFWGVLYSPYHLSPE